ncbi:MAG: molybdopterin converting factor subunit 1 [Planctomycetes bacterium]|nr:molybdopterin converting factor subunit 1 [Planctomycetota bacterium]
MPEPGVPIRVTLRCFAAVRETLGTDSMTVEVAAGTTVHGLREKVAESHPALLRLPVAFAINRDYARAESVLEDGDEVAFIPPISGGSGDRELYRFDLTDGVIDPRALEAECRTDRDGAVVTFAGTTRDHNEGAEVLSLSYETYTEMAQRVMCGLFEEAIKRFPITRARVVHRLGEVPVGEASVVVVVASPHRGPAFDACRFLMDRLKNEVPIWKREKLRDGAGERWIGDLPRPGGEG